MSKKDASLNMAIEALEDAQSMLGDGASSIPDYFINQINACKEALAESEQQESQKPQWVSVQDRLPLEQKKVLLCFDGGLIVVGRFLQGKFCHYNFDDDRYYSEKGVTHWMPLPDAPKENKHE